MAPIFDWYKNKNVSYIITFTDLVILGCKIYIINYKLWVKAVNPRTNKYPRACHPAVYPSLFPQIVDGLFMGYSNFTKVIIYFDPKTRCIKKTFHCYID